MKSWREEKKLERGKMLVGSNEKLKEQKEILKRSKEVKGKKQKIERKCSKETENLGDKQRKVGEGHKNVKGWKNWKEKIIVRGRQKRLCEKKEKL